MKISAIIAAAGTGSRAGFEKNKLFAEIDGAPVICRTVSAFLQCEEIDEILLAASENDAAEMRALFVDDGRVRIVLGGVTRSQSVYNALQACNEPDYVLIHDGARPFVTRKLILDCIETARSHGSAVCAVKVTDTTVLCNGQKIVSIPDRDTVYALQTPQGFSYREILSAYRASGGENFTDDSSVYGKYIAPPQIFPGDPHNKKLTFRDDFISPVRVGVGIDTHAFGKDLNYIVLGGVRVPSDSGLIAHSDGDVLLHAIMDALLSSAGLPDIGHYFPDTDPAFSGADSLLLLEKVRALIAEKKLIPRNVSAAIQAQKPRLARYIPAMRENIAAVLGVDVDRVGISAGTCEGLGYIGEGKGITVTAYVSCTEI